MHPTNSSKYAGMDFNKVHHKDGEIVWSGGTFVWIGMCLAIGAALISNLGVNIQKSSHIKVD